MAIFSRVRGRLPGALFGCVAGRRRGDVAKKRGESEEAGVEERRSLRRKGRHRKGVGRVGDEEEQPMLVPVAVHFPALD